MDGALEGLVVVVTVLLLMVVAGVIFATKGRNSDPNLSRTKNFENPMYASSGPVAAASMAQRNPPAQQQTMYADIDAAPPSTSNTGGYMDVSAVPTTSGGYMDIHDVEEDV